MRYFWTFYRKGDRSPYHPHFCAPCDMYVLIDSENNNALGAIYRLGDDDDRWAMTWAPEEKSPRILDANLTVVECKEKFLNWRLK